MNWDDWKDAAGFDRSTSKKNKLNTTNKLIKSNITNK